MADDQLEIPENLDREVLRKIRTNQATGRTFAADSPEARFAVDNPIRVSDEREERIQRQIADRTPENRVFRGANITPATRDLALGGVDEEAIRAEQMERARVQVAGIEEDFSTQLREEKVRGEDRAGSTRSASAFAGVLESPFGAAKKQKTEDFNTRQEAAITAQKELRINAIFNEFDAKANAAIALSKQEALATFEANKQQSREQIALISNTGISLEAMADEDYNNLFQQSAFSSKLAFEAFYNANLPQEVKVDYKYMQLDDGTLFRYGSDGTGESMGNFAAPSKTGNWSPETIEGQMYWVNKDENGNILEFEKFETDKGDDIKNVQTFQSNDGSLFERDPFTGQWNVAIEPTQKPLTDAEKKKRDDAIQGDADILNALEVQVRLIDNLLVHEGLDTVVGSNPLARGAASIGGALDLASGVAADFSGKTETLISQKALASLIDAKSRGATFGALSDTEMDILRAAATTLGAWQSKSKKRFKIDEESFKEELLRMKGAAERLINRGKTAIEAGETQTQDLRTQFEQSGIDGNFDDLINKYGEDMVKSVIESSGGGQQGFNKDLSRSQKGSVLGLGQVTGLGSRFWKHGLDIDLKIGDGVPSPSGGRVVFVGNNGGFGHQVRIRTSRGNEMWLSHLKSSDVKVGDNIAKGQIIGEGGNTGNVIPLGGGDGSHLDFTVVDSQGNFMTPQEILNRLS